MLSKNHIRAINRARQALRDLESKTSTDTRFSYGKFAEACRTAEGALFNVLLIAKHWLDEEVADSEMHAEKEEEVEV